MLSRTAPRGYSLSIFPDEPNSPRHQARRSCIVMYRFELEWRRTAMALKSMSVAKLRDLRDQVDAAIAQKITARRSELEMELSALARHDPQGPRGKARGRGP